MASTWGPSSMLWQMVHTGSQFNPLAWFNPTIAKQWYAQQSASLWQTGHPFKSVFLSIAGGYVSAPTGSPASAAQAWWSIPFKALGPWADISAALCQSVDSLTGGQQLSGVTAGYGIVGLLGDWAGVAARLMPAKIYLGDGGQYMWGFGSESIMRTASGLQTIHNFIGAFGFGGDVGEALFQSLDQAASSSATSTGGSARVHLKSDSPPPRPPDWPPPPPDKGGPAAVPTEVGGVLFDYGAVLTDVEEISGAYWDPRTGSLVLVGKEAATNDAVKLGLPNMDGDHLAVALRASLAGQAMGVSIDPESKYRDGIMRGVTPADGTPMFVSYLGNTEGTLFGAIMFEADRLLKCLDSGIDNETQKPVRASVPGFKTLLEMIHPGDGHPENVWHRFWFVIDKVELKHDPVSGAVAFGDVRLKVQTEIEKESQAKGQYVDPADEAFARYLTEHYDELAKDFPILARLKELAKVAAVAKFLVNQGIPLNIEILVTLPPVPAKTAKSTPGISVTSPNVEVRHEGNVVHTRTVSLFGGVDMDSDPHILPDDGTPRRLKEMAELSRPSPAAPSWSFRKNGTASRALTSRIGQSGNPFRRFCDDHYFVSRGDEGSLRLRRVYDSSSLHKGDFGSGWSLWVPFSMTAIPPSGKRPEVLTQKELAKLDTNPVLVLHDRKTQKSDIYRFTGASSPDSRAVFCRVTSQTQSRGKISFSYDPSDSIRREGDCFILERENCAYCFDSNGYLLEVKRRNMCIARYVRDNARIVRIVDGLNQAYDIRYERSEAARIVEVIPSSGSSIAYSYDQSGLLASCQGGRCSERYRYDSAGLLTEIRAPSGQVISRTVYSRFGDLVNTPSDVVTDQTGGRIVRSFEQSKLVSLKDELGSSQILGYGAQGELAEIQICDRINGVWRLGYDSAGRMANFRDPLGHTILLQHDESGRVTRCVGPRGDSRTFQLDQAGRLACVADQDGHQWTFEYDKGGNLSRAKGPGDTHWDYEYAEGMVVKIGGPAGKVRAKPKKDTLGMKVVASGGMSQESVWDRYGRLVRSQVKGAKPVRFQYADDGQTFSVLSEYGTVRYQVDDKKLAVDVTFDV